MEYVPGILLFIAIFCIYFLPSIIAHNGKHHNSQAITLLNLFLGWTILGWLAALIWACTKPAPLVLSKSN